MLIDREMFNQLAHSAHMFGTPLLPHSSARAAASARVAGAVEIPPPEAVPAIAQWAAETLEHTQGAAKKIRHSSKLAEDIATVKAHIVAELKGDTAEGNRILNQIVARLGAKPAASKEKASTASREQVHYVEVTEDEVPPAVRVRATLSMARALEALDLDAPKLRWFRPENASETAHREHEAKAGREVERAPVPNGSWGVARYLTNAVWLAADMPLEEVAFTAAHECAHLYQMQEIPRLRINNRVTAMEAEWMEWDANAFAERFVEPVKPAA